MEELSGAKFKSIAPAALLLGVLLQGCDNLSGKTDAEYLAAAKDFYLKDNYPAGMLELKNALQVNPDNAEARRLLGEVNVKLGAGAAAEKELRRAMELGVALEAVAPSLAEALSQQGKYKELLAEISAEASADPATKAVLLSYRGDAWLALAKPDEASKEYKLAEEVAPKAYQPKLGLAQIALADNRPDNAMKLADQALELAPDEPRVFAFKASLHELKKEWDKAEAMYTEAISHSKIPNINYLHRALVRIELGKLDLAAGDLAKAKKVAPKSFQTYFVEGRLALAQGKSDEAERALEESVKLNPQYVFSRYYLAAANLLQGHLEQAETNVRLFLSAVPGSIPGQLLTVLTKLRMGDAASAKQNLEPLLAAQPENAILVQLMGRIEFALGNMDEALVHMQKAARFEPKSAKRQNMLGIGLLLGGKTDKALDSFQKAAELQPDSEQPIIYLFLGELQAKNFTKAQDLLADLEKKRLNDIVLSNLKGMLALAQGDRTAARKAFEESFKREPGNILAGLTLASFASRENRPEEGRAYLKKILERHPENLQAQMGLAQLAAQAGDKKELEAELRRSVELSPRTVGPRVVLARYYMLVGQPRSAQQVLEEIRNVHGENPELLAALIEAELGLGQAEQALTTATALTKAAPEDPASHYYLARALGETGDLVGMREALEKSIKISDSYLPAKITMMRMHAADKNWPEAHKVLKALQSNYPEDSEVMALAGWLAMVEGKAEDAVAAYRSAFDKEPSRESAIALSNALWKANLKDEALQVLRGWVERNGQDMAAHQALGMLYARLGKTEESLRQLNQALELNPKNSAVLNELATLLRKDHPDQALGYAQEAVKLAPESPVYRATLGLVLLQKDEPTGAVRLLREVVKQAPKSAVFRLYLAQAEAAAGNNDEAVKLLRVLVRPETPTAERSAAEALLKRLEAR